MWQETCGPYSVELIMATTIFKKKKKKSKKTFGGTFGIFKQSNTEKHTH